MTKSEIKAAIVLINMGGPENLEEASAFMRRLFNDSHIMNIPSPCRMVVAQRITIIRARRVRKHYGLMGGGSPLKKWTRLQGEAILAHLKTDCTNIRLFDAYSYSEPLIHQVISKLTEGDVEKIIAVPLYPHYSYATLGSVYADLEKARHKYNLNNRLRIIQPFFEHPQFIRASIELLRNALGKIDTGASYQVIFSAHALPQNFIDRGDPYRHQVERTVGLILKEFPIENWALAYQSKIGPVAWMQPSTIEAVRTAAKQGIKQLAVIPIGFVCDHFETLYELDIELAAIARESGIEKFVRGEVFNINDTFIKMLVELISQEFQ